MKLLTEVLDTCFLLRSTHPDFVNQIVTIAILNGQFIYAKAQVCVRTVNLLMCYINRITDINRIPDIKGLRINDERLAQLSKLEKDMGDLEAEHLFATRMLSGPIKLYREKLKRDVEAMTKANNGLRGFWRRFLG